MLKSLFGVVQCHELHKSLVNNTRAIKSVVLGWQYRYSQPSRHFIIFLKPVQVMFVSRIVADLTC